MFFKCHLWISYLHVRKYAFLLLRAQEEDICFFYQLVSRMMMHLRLFLLILNRYLKRKLVFF